VRFTPPATMTEADVDWMLTAVGDALRETFSKGHR
jgi:putrescine aminotransferase